jgi:hypothetical protein
MPNISGEYTLSEAAVKLEVSPAWIGKVRNLTGIGGSMGVQGRKATFTDKELEALGRANIMRILGFDYKDIKHLYQIEETIIGAFKGYKNDIISVSSILFLHSDVKLSMPIEKEDEKKIAIALSSVLREYLESLLEIKRRATRVRERLVRVEPNQELKKAQKVAGFLKVK